MLEASISILFVYAIYTFVNWLRHRKSIKPSLAPHKRIARSIWIYCFFIITVAILMASFTEIDSNKFYRPMYGEYKGWYFPYGRYSDLRIGDIRNESTIISENYHNHIVNNAILMGRRWEEVPDEEAESPYEIILKSLHTYDPDCNSNTYGHGMMLRVYDLDNEIAESKDDEKSGYNTIINKLVSDSSFYKLSKAYEPYMAIETPVYATISVGDKSPTVFKKHITIFTNFRAYELNFYVDKEVKKPLDSNTFDFLDSEFKKVASELDLHSYKDWQEQESQYLSNLHVKCWIFVTLYILCIIGAFSFALRYYRNAGAVNPKAAKATRVLSTIDFVIFAILGVSFIITFCTIHYEHIDNIYLYQFSAFINDEHAATSVLCYGAYFLLLIIPTNKFYIKSYSETKPQEYSDKSNRRILYWVVRPFALISKFFSKSTKALREEFNKQISDNK